MIPELKAKWVAALRSGDYKQGTEFLKAGSATEISNGQHEYCCLGVLCEILNIPSVPYPNAAGEVYDYKFGEAGQDAGLIPTNYFHNDLGFDRLNQPVLMTMNDGVQSETETIPPKTFAEIADYIEKEINEPAIAN